MKKNDTAYSATSRIYNLLSLKPTEENFNKMQHFMFQAVSFFVKDSCKLVNKCFVIAKGYYFEGKMEREFMQNCSHEIYNYLSSKDAILEWEDPEICSIKAVKCLFYSFDKSRSDEMADTFETFVELVSKLLNENQLLELLKNFKKNPSTFKVY